MKKKSPYYSKAGSIVFLSSPEQYLRKLYGGRVRNLKFSGPGPIQECTLSMICVTDWSL